MHRFPNEPEQYRKARNDLLDAEKSLRKKLADVARQRQDLPLGGELKENYLFDEAESVENETVIQTSFTDLFSEGKKNLFMYSFMFSPEAENPCPACTSLIDGLNGSAPHIRDRINFVVVAKAPIEKFRAWAASRNWKNIRLLSSNNNTYNADYFAESDDGTQQMPAINVFRKNENGIYHFYNSELLYTEPNEDQHPRHADLLWPIWNIFDMTPDGRGNDWFPKYSYD